MNLIDFFTIPVNSITEMTFFFSIIIKKKTAVEMMTLVDMFVTCGML